MTKTEENRKKYLKSPDLATLESFIKELGVRDCQFERFYGIPKKTIAQMRYDGRDLPAKFWHIVYEKIKPAYGSGFLEPVQRRKFSKVIVRLKNSLTEKSVTKEITQVSKTIDIKGRLADLM